MAARKENNYGSILSLLPSFENNENEDIDYFISQIDAICGLAKLDKAVKLILLRNKLKGAALQFVTQNEQMREEQNYDTFKVKLTERFKKDKNIFEAQNAFMTTEQKQSETVKQFKERIETAAAKFLSATRLQDSQGAIQFNEKLKLSKFLDGLRPEIKLETKMRGPQNFQEAFEIAKTIEMALNGTETPVNNITQDTTILDIVLQGQKEQDLKMQQIEKKLEELTRANTQQNNQQIICQICGKPRHTARQCWYNIQTTPQGTIPQRHFRPRTFETPQLRTRPDHRFSNNRTFRPRFTSRANRGNGRNQTRLNQ